MVEDSDDLGGMRLNGGSVYKINFVGVKKASQKADVFLFEEGGEAEHLFAGGDAEFAEDVVVVVFEGALLDGADFEDFVCGFAIEIELKHGLFHFGEGFYACFECLIGVGIDLGFARIGKARDFGLGFT